MNRDMNFTNELTLCAKAIAYKEQLIRLKDSKGRTLEDNVDVRK